MKSQVRPPASPWRRQRSSGSSGEKREDDGGEGEADGTDTDVEKAAEDAQAALADGDDPTEGRVNMVWDPRPDARGGGDDWERRTVEKRLSAAGAAAQAPDRQRDAGDGDGASGEGTGRFGAKVNLRGYPWTDPQAGNVPCSEHGRLKELAEKWYGKALVGDGADAVERSDLDAW